MRKQSPLNKNNDGYPLDSPRPNRLWFAALVGSVLIWLLALAYIVVLWRPTDFKRIGPFRFGGTPYAVDVAESSLPHLRSGKCISVARKSISAEKLLPRLDRLNVLHSRHGVRSRLEKEQRLQERGGPEVFSCGANSAHLGLVFKLNRVFVIWLHRQIWLRDFSLRPAINQPDADRSEER